MKAFAILFFSCLSLLGQSVLLPGGGIAWTSATSVPAFNPNTLNPILWVDIDSNVINHAGSTTPANNDTIKGWGDNSVNHMDLTNAAGSAAEPVYHTTGGPNNGKRLSFTGAAAMCLTNRNTTVYSQPNSFYMVFNTAGGASYGIMNCMDSQNEQLTQDLTTSFNWFAGTGNAIGNRLNTYGVGGWGLVIFEFNGASSQVYTNFFTPQGAVNLGAGAMKGMTFGSYFNQTLPGPTDITDLVWFNSVLSAANRTNMINWLATKRGITLPPH